MMNKLSNNNRRYIRTGNKEDHERRVLGKGAVTKLRGDSVGAFNTVDPSKATVTSYSKLLNVK